eukprot:CAMPEP_0178425034 /NCGR_PEP_ID=MMETSP0689_2-20121128/28516_1 /TAXON_ID=160604 /ORGANISM="Amphidinium massartii, Strain CS-259" /LENGTH=125 /DNA_ID=CAMNT_0020046687 /DNA_START=32 /DNA_END=409 /DNA_ORIENTATION=-
MTFNSALDEPVDVDNINDAGASVPTASTAPGASSTSSRADPSAQQGSQRRREYEATYFPPQLLLTCICAIMLAAAYVWWRRSSEDHAGSREHPGAFMTPTLSNRGSEGPNLEERLTEHRHDSYYS